jgi:pentatricopeptide repeat protein
VYRNFIKTVFSLILTLGSLQSQEPFVIDGVREDVLIIEAIWLEESGDISGSAGIYSDLYRVTKKKEYLFKEVSNRLYNQNMVGDSLKKLKKWSASHPNNLIGKRLLISLYLQEKSYDDAIMVSATLIENSDKDEDLELVASSYLYSGEYKKGVELLNRLYQKTNNEQVLLRVVAIMTQYMDKNSEAIRLLETYRRINDASIETYKMLIDLYVKEKNLDRILDVYKSLYHKEQDEDYKRRIIEIFVYQRDFKNMIKFLEKYSGNDTLLYDLYKKEKEFGKAIKLAQKFYKKTEKPKWLAELAILKFENAEDKDNKKMLNEVIKLFSKAISLGVDDSIYLNYYGYTLIDKKIDIDKGMDIINNALKQQPKNSYYLDSMAWGYFNKSECQKAYKLMKQVIEQEGTNELEIKEHWEQIKECMKSTLISWNS